MSNRLDSLNTKKPASAGKPSLKFKPKAVERKSKEERDKNAKVKKEEEKPQTQPKPRGLKSTRGRGGRNQYANTHVLSSGLLSSGAVSSGGIGKETKVFNSISPSPEFIQNLKRKESTPVKSSDSDSEDDDLTKIDMSREYKFAEEETILFPVRPQRITKDEFFKEPSPVKEEPEQQEQPGAGTEDTSESVSTETELQHILATKANLESKISQPVDLLNQVESEKLTQDYKQMVRVINDKFGDDKFMLFQLPKVLPEYKKKEAQVEVSETDGTKSLSPPQPTETEKTEKTEKDKHPDTNKFSSDVPSLDGQIGSLNVHKSGKVTLNLGNDINMDMTIGVESRFLQEFVLLNMEEIDQPKVKKEQDDMDIDEENEVKGALHKLGEIDGKLIATPSI